MKKYNLELTERQAKRIILALDLYTRLSTGQLNELNNLTFEKDKDGLNVKASRRILTFLQKAMFHLVKKERKK